MPRMAHLTSNMLLRILWIHVFFSSSLDLILLPFINHHRSLSIHQIWACSSRMKGAGSCLWTVNNEGVFFLFFKTFEILWTKKNNDRRYQFIFYLQTADVRHKSEQKIANFSYSGKTKRIEFNTIRMTKWSITHVLFANIC